MIEKLSPWREGLRRTRDGAIGRLANLLGATEITPRTWETLETLLIEADLGAQTVGDVLASLRREARDQGLTTTAALRAALRANLRARLQSPPVMQWTARPAVILVVGVNGSGKTTTIAKLASRFKAEGSQVVLGAADTFRAAAVEQLSDWAGRLQVEIISGPPESDAGAVAFNAVQSGVARNADVVLIDTAGRLHSRLNLMEELKKVYRVAGKAMAGAPQAVWLVLDATTGQNALQQARAFTQAVGVSGVILAKLDASARGGMAFAIHRELGLPILFAGLGEAADDLRPFDPDAFVDGILA